jgi:hypothetical protein
VPKLSSFYIRHSFGYYAKYKTLYVVCIQAGSTHSFSDGLQKTSDQQDPQLLLSLVQNSHDGIAP